LVNMEGRDDYVIQNLNPKYGLKPGDNIKELLFEDEEYTREVSRLQRQGIKSGEIEVYPLKGVEEQLMYERSRGDKIFLFSVGTDEMVKSCIEGAGLEKYIDEIYSSEQAGTGNKKTVKMFLEAYEELLKQGQRIESYCDDTLKDVEEAVKASEKIGEGFKVYHINKDATDDGLGDTEKGYTIISSISEKDNNSEQEGDTDEQD